MAFSVVWIEKNTLQAEGKTLRKKKHIKQKKVKLK